MSCTDWVPSPLTRDCPWGRREAAAEEGDPDANAKAAAALAIKANEDKVCRVVERSSRDRCVVVVVVVVVVLVTRALVSSSRAACPSLRWRSEVEREK